MLSYIIQLPALDQIYGPAFHTLNTPWLCLPLQIKDNFILTDNP